MKTTILSLLLLTLITQVISQEHEDTTKNCLSIPYKDGKTFNLGPLIEEKLGIRNTFNFNGHVDVRQYKAVMCDHGTVPDCAVGCSSPGFCGYSKDGAAEETFCIGEFSGARALPDDAPHVGVELFYTGGKDGKHGMITILCDEEEGAFFRGLDIATPTRSLSGYNMTFYSTVVCEPSNVLVTVLVAIGITVVVAAVTLGLIYVFFIRKKDYQNIKE
eukprot:TRINITY_DN12436_c0_g1_i1.p1 TRINITY_DN12436_c0_g1~~TRINITY_DN12436_c0_g1_i1.p1  ORF type:complete len:217 (-),score=43.44 TRINITY_DN12436_c0_g1_i1:15-665(-)